MEKDLIRAKKREKMRIWKGAKNEKLEVLSVKRASVM